MYKVSFNNDEMAINYVNGLFESGLRSVSTLEQLKYGRFFVTGNEVYISLVK